MLLNSGGGVGPRVTKLLHDQGVGTIRSGSLSSAEERLLARCLSDVFWVVDKLGLPRYVAEKAGELAWKAVAAKVVKRARKPTAAAMVYIASNHHGICKTLGDIAAATDVSVNQLSREIGKIVFGLNIKVKPLDTVLFIERITKSLYLDGETTEMACQIYRISSVDRKLSGRKPSAVSAAAVYLACKRRNVKITLNSVAEAGGISVLTLRKTVSLLQNILTEKRKLDQNKSS
ncbi:MAG: transcription initiation factor IIB family protein [Candidatus Caldarchaeum sp.]|nr:transcription initiation factor IIB family protein [Candidatus Caldarchaeum sp.]